MDGGARRSSDMAAVCATRLLGPDCRLGRDDVRADVLPAQKRELVQQLQHDGRRVAMAGDGINDAPDLAEAEVGIAMGTGTDVAMESAGVTLVKGDLRGIARTRRLSRTTMRNVRQNLFLAFVYNSIGVPVAAGVLYPLSGIPISNDLGECYDDTELCVGHRERAAPPPRRTVISFPSGASVTLSILLAGFATSA